MEICENGELFDYINSHGPIGEKMANKIFYQLYDALCYLHNKNITHRDIKTENILLDSHMNIKLIDFGLATTYERGEKLKSFCGSPSYLAPEVVLRKKYDPELVDVWCLGIALYIMYEARIPFYDDNDDVEKNKILNYDYTPMTNPYSDAAALIK